MKAALLLIDLQSDYLAAARLEPAAGHIVEAAQLLAVCRRLKVPIVHIVTTVRRDPDNRMPHWKLAGRWQCEEHAPGHQPPEALRSIDGEAVFSKQFFSAFGAPDLDSFLKSLSCDTLLLAGVHLHACVRATALDAYERGYGVWIIADAVGSDDPVHAAITRRYLSARSIRFESSRRATELMECGAANAEETSGGDEIELRCPHETEHVLAKILIEGTDQVDRAVAAARRPLDRLRRRPIAERAGLLARLAEGLDSDHDLLARQITLDVGKPITLARAEVRRSIALLHAVAAHAAAPLNSRTGPGVMARHQPLGVVAVVTPWNNPLAIPVGKIAPAILYGNTVVWKPAPFGTRIAQRMLELARDANWREGQDDLLALCTGDHTTASALGESGGIDGLTLSGSLQAGYALGEICARRHVPFQGEMGGNNAAIVWDDTDLPRAARSIAAGAFGFAGQRCTANRRVIIAEHCRQEFVDELLKATAAIKWGDPFNEATVIGPLIDVAKRDEVVKLLDRARAAGMEIHTPHREQGDYADLMNRGAYHPPAIVFAEDGRQEIVQEETFGPVLVVQAAATFDQALELANGPRQGLIAALFSSSATRREHFLAEARAGVLKFDASTVDADATSPLGGWKASGAGPAEHGASDREFFTRVQTVYDATLT